MHLRIVPSLIALVLFTGCGNHPQPQESQLRVVGGTESSLVHHPWQISIQKRDNAESPFVHYCGGAFMNDQQIVTAAHCFNYVEKYDNHVIRFGGDGHLENLQGTALIGEVKIHEDYKYGSYDVAVVTLTEPVVFADYENVAAIGIAKGPLPEAGSKVTISGWGATSSRLEDNGRYDLQFPDQLQETELELLPPASSDFWSEDAYNNYFPKRKQLGGAVQVESFQKDLTLALHGDQERGACRGDSGGPAFIIENGAPVLIGITSQGTDSATCKAVSLYTSLYITGDWVRSQLRQDKPDHESETVSLTQETLPVGEPCDGFCDYYFAQSHFAAQIEYREYDADHWIIDEIRSTLTSANQIINGVGDSWEADRFVVYSAGKKVFDDRSHNGHFHKEDLSSHWETTRPEGGIIVKKGDNRIEVHHEYILRDRSRQKPNEYYRPKRYVENM